MIINGKRALAYTAKIDKISPIPNADNIELAYIKGWTLITKKGEFKEGDPCVYFEIDSRLPAKEWSEFLTKRNYKVKTMKLSKFGVISQGLALPLCVFDVSIPENEGVDVTELLGVTYSVAEDNIRKEIKLSNEVLLNRIAQRHPKFFKSKVVKNLLKLPLWQQIFIALFIRDTKDNAKRFPNHFPFVHKTDEERVENLAPRILEDKRVLTATEKLDGTSTTFILERKPFGKYEFYVLSRSVRQLSADQSTYHDSNIYWEMALKYDVENQLKSYLKENPNLKYVALQGESVGNVQGNPLKLKENDFYGYNFIRSDCGRVPTLTAKQIAIAMGIKWVPIVQTDWVNPDTMEEMKELAEGKSLVNPAVLREGLVYRDEQDNSFSFKNVARSYLLKHNG